MATWTNEQESTSGGEYVLLIDDTFKLLIDDTYQLLLQDGSAVGWTNESES